MVVGGLRPGDPGSALQHAEGNMEGGGRAREQGNQNSDVWNLGFMWRLGHGLKFIHIEARQCCGLVAPIRTAGRRQRWGKRRGVPCPSWPGPGSFTVETGLRLSKKMQVVKACGGAGQYAAWHGIRARGLQTRRLEGGPQLEFQGLEVGQTQHHSRHANCKINILVVRSNSTCTAAHRIRGEVGLAHFVQHRQTASEQAGFRLHCICDIRTL